MVAEVCEVPVTSLRFEARKPSQLIRSGMPQANLGLVGLVRYGYGFESLPQPELIERVLEEYGGEDNRRQSYLAFRDKTLVSSVTFGLWTPEEAKRGVKFWDSLPDGIRERGLATSPLAVDMVGNVVLPQNRGQGIGGKLLEHGAIELNPSVIVGETQSPHQVVSRARNLAPLGYETFYGHTNITPGREERFTKDSQGVTKAYLEAKGKELFPGGVIHISPDILLPRIPDVSRFPVIIQEVFASLIEEQRRVKGNSTVMKSLVSIKSSVLRGS